MVYKLFDKRTRLEPQFLTKEDLIEYAQEQVLMTHLLSPDRKSPLIKSVQDAIQILEAEDYVIEIHPTQPTNTPL